MDRHRFDTDEQLVTETRAQFSTLTSAVLAGDPIATKRITDALGEFIADDNSAAELVRAVLLNSQAALTVITDLIWAEAGELAEAEVALQERRRAESRDDNRISMALASLAH